MEINSFIYSFSTTSIIMKIFVKVFNNFYPTRPTSTFTPLDHTTKLKFQENITQFNLLKTVYYLFKNTFTVTLHPSVKDFIDHNEIPNHCLLNFKLFENYTHEWESYSMDKRSDEERLPDYVVKTLFNSTMEDWKLFLPILCELEKTHILYCNVIIYVNRSKEIDVETGIERSILKIDLEHFIDFLKKEDIINSKELTLLEKFCFLDLKEVLSFIQTNFYEEFNGFFSNCSITH